MYDDEDTSSDTLKYRVQVGVLFAGALFWVGVIALIRHLLD